MEIANLLNSSSAFLPHSSQHHNNAEEQGVHDVILIGCPNGGEDGPREFADARFIFMTTNQCTYYLTGTH